MPILKLAKGGEGNTAELAKAAEGSTAEELSHEDLFNESPQGSFAEPPASWGAAVLDSPARPSVADWSPPHSPNVRGSMLNRVASSTSVDIPITPDDELPLEDARRGRSQLVGPSAAPVSGRGGERVRAEQAALEALPSDIAGLALQLWDAGDSAESAREAPSQASDEASGAREGEGSGPPRESDPSDASRRRSSLGGASSKLTPGDFDILSLVGQGAFGKVFQVQHRATGRIFAMKVMKKAAVLEKNQAEYMRTERDVLKRVDHPFIVTLRYSFQA